MTTAGAEALFGAASGRKVATVVLMCGLLAGCGTWPFSRADTSPDAGMARGLLEPVPPDGLEIADGIWMVPLGTDATGCARFRMMSNAKAVLNGTFYRTMSGDFTTRRGLSACATA